MKKVLKWLAIGICAFFVIGIVGAALTDSPETTSQNLASDKPETPKTIDSAAYYKKIIEKQFSPWDGSHIALTKYIKNVMNDPKSFEHIETKYWNFKDHLVVIERFTGTNVYGGVVQNFVKAKVDMDGNIIEIMQTSE